MKTKFNSKRFMAIIMAVMLMILSAVSVMPAMAAEHLDKNATVGFTVKCDKPGYTFTVYKVANLVSTTTSPFETKYDSLVDEINDEILSGNTSEIVKALDKVDTMPATATVVGTYSSDDGNKATFDNLTQGIYYVRATNFPAGVKAVTNSVAALPYYDGTTWQYTINDIELAAKVADGTPTTEKTITNSTKDNVNFTDVSLGDTVNFELRSTTAGSSSMKLKTYKLYDDMSAGLTLDKESFNVALLEADGDVISELSDTDYTVTITSEGEGLNTTFDVSLKESFLKTESLYNSNVYYVSVTYSATLNEYSVIGTQGNPNEEVKLEYANKNGVTSEVEGNTVYVYTYTLQTVKVKEDKTPLEGAEFALFRTESDAKNQENAIATGVSDADGLVVYKTTDGDIIKLQSGEYFIVETKAPQGFALHGNPIPVQIEATYGDTFVNNTYVTSCSTNGTASVDVVNYPIVLPATGGAGTVIFSVVSIIAGAGSAVFFVMYMRKKKATANN